MHYYNRNIGDYHKKAGRLSMLEHGAYTLLLDACYDRERFPTLDEALDWCWARTGEERAAVEFVLGKFFALQDGVYVQRRVADEVEEYKIKGVVNQLVALSREAKKKNKLDFAKECEDLKDEIKHDPLAKTYAAWTELVDSLNKKHAACTSVQDRAPNQEPITNNQEPITNINISMVSEALPEPQPQNQIAIIPDQPVSKITRFEPPTQSEARDYFFNKGSTDIEADKFVLFYESKGWKVGKSPMKKWESAATGWILRNKQDNSLPAARASPTSTRDLTLEQELNNNAWAMQ
jgi:uncharacterized protein YdaU (DUF1376 family)